MSIQEMLFGTKCAACGQKIKGEKRVSPETSVAPKQVFVCEGCYAQIELNNRRLAEEEARKKEEKTRREEQAARERAEKEQRWREEQERRAKEEEARRAEQSQEFIRQLKKQEASPGLLRAAEKGDIEAARLCLEAAADVNYGDEIRQRPLHAAACTSEVDLVNLLVDKGADVDARDSYGQTALHWWCARTLSVAAPLVGEALLARGANVNATDGNDLTPLHCAAMEGKAPAAQLLLAKGADPFAVSRRGRSAFYYAVEAGAIEVQEILAPITGESSAGLEVNATNALDVLHALKAATPIIRLKSPSLFRPETLAQDQQKELAGLLKLEQSGGYTMLGKRKGELVFAHLTYKPPAPVRKQAAP